ncbi:hypothetical protein SAMN05216516_11255 [Izhakiella capsodis]|uniref:Uncharacterized protein n=1 Tax=Izhakiella capsodis TaxID=1367852 RepID=A0A1I5AKS1_9GAMM|nr:hypothetical protein SAMN05216516_11255 [Izhakiella capsodis]
MSWIGWQQRFETWFKVCGQKEDYAHDIDHLRRVWQTVRRIMQIYLP